LISPYFPHHIVRKVAFFKELDGIGHVVSLDHNLVSDTVGVHLMTSPGNTMTNPFVHWFNDAVSTADVSPKRAFLLAILTVSITRIYGITRQN
jgi:hypothetical protein